MPLQSASMKSSALFQKAYAEKMLSGPANLSTRSQWPGSTSDAVLSRLSHRYNCGPVSGTFVVGAAGPAFNFDAGPLTVIAPVFLQFFRRQIVVIAAKRVVAFSRAGLEAGPHDPAFHQGAVNASYDRTKCGSGHMGERGAGVNPVIFLDCGKFIEHHRADGL